MPHLQDLLALGRLVEMRGRIRLVVDPDARPGLAEEQALKYLANSGTTGSRARSETALSVLRVGHSYKWHVKIRTSPQGGKRSDRDMDRGLHDTGLGDGACACGAREARRTLDHDHKSKEREPGHERSSRDWTDAGASAPVPNRLYCRATQATPRSRSSSWAVGLGAGLLTSAEVAQVTLLEPTGRETRAPPATRPPGFAADTETEALLAFGTACFRGLALAARGIRSAAQMETGACS